MTVLARSDRGYATIGGEEANMADRLNIEIVGRLVPLLLRIAREEGRAPDKVLEEAFLLYLRERGVEPDPDIGRALREIYVEPPEGQLNVGFLALLDRMSSRFDLDEDEAMRIAVEEQHAFRRERAEREGEGR
jgi:hypothetical protein